MKVKTAELTGAALDWLVDNIEGVKNYGVKDWLEQRRYDNNARYSTDWVQAGPIIDREITKIFRNVGGTWSAMILKDVPIPPEDRGTSLASTHRVQWNGAGPTILIAAMRCYVASKLGDEIEIPDALRG